MAVTVSFADFTTFDAADAIGNWNTTGYAQEAVDPTANVQGTNCIEARGIDNGGVGELICNAGSTNMEDKHLFAWLRQSFIWATFDNATAPGISLRLSDTANGTSNYVEFAVGGQDRGITSYLGWVNCCVSTKARASVVDGTSPERSDALATVITVTARIHTLTGNNKVVAMCDEIKLGNFISITGGTDASPGICSEIAAVDLTNGEGLFKEVGGVFFVCCGVDFGLTTNTAYTFEDVSQAIIFEDWDVDAEFYRFRHLAGTATSVFALGIKNGIGTDATGSSGCQLKSAGLATFHILSQDTDCDQVGYYGCSFIGPAGLFKYSPTIKYGFYFDASGSSFTDQRFLWGQNGLTGNLLPATPAVGDYACVGLGRPFSMMLLDVTTVATGSPVFAWEYLNSAGTWTALEDVYSDAKNFTTGTPTYITWRMPPDWDQQTVNSKTAYWVRARVTTAPTNQPQMNTFIPYVGGDFQLETANTEMISCVIVGMGTIRVRNGAIFHKNTISNAVVHGMEAALDLGSSDPATDTVRDLEISGCQRGILLQGTSTGTTTYNFRNISFRHNGHQPFVYYYSGTVYTDLSESIQDPTIDDVVFSDANTNAAVYFGSFSPFKTMMITVAVVAPTTWTDTWEYWNGTAWTAVSGFARSQGTFSLDTLGTTTFSWTMPTDWEYTDVNGNRALWMRMRNSSGTTLSPPPQIRHGNEAGDVIVDFPSAATVEISISEGGSIPNIDNVNGSTVNILTGEVTTTITCRDSETKAAIEGAAVTILADATGNLPYNASVTITRTGSTATVSHTGHGFSTGQKVKIAGANQNEYNRIKTITVVDANSYTFAVTGTPTTPATGTITSTAVIIDAETNASGQVSDTRSLSADQAITGFAAKGTSSPIYVRAPISETISNTTGLSLTVLMISDE